jgi:hypothetical protein
MGLYERKVDVRRLSKYAYNFLLKGIKFLKKWTVVTELFKTVSPTKTYNSKTTKLSFKSSG